ncbi:hypothetical protein ADIAG_00446 [Paeniglutamicibacter gangotriensis Lz1y]|uniref:Uncharacterized protein n=1 Tax=Paeniglutamicibacter gangotriensis Lz1y TaxID=1276920 RepID=M7NPI9_9MICC|nr:hypothetical protein ADIAG_00446 [Paeniglutamicibacter gangotriensis Lz1y]
MNDGVKGDGRSLGGNHRRRPEIFARHVVVAPTTNHQIAPRSHKPGSRGPNFLGQVLGCGHRCRILGWRRQHLPASQCARGIGMFSSLRPRPAPSTSGPLGPDRPVGFAGCRGRTLDRARSRAPMGCPRRGAPRPVDHPRRSGREPVLRRRAPAGGPATLMTDGALSGVKNQLLLTGWNRAKGSEVGPRSGRSLQHDPNL